MFGREQVLVSRFPKHGCELAVKFTFVLYLQEKPAKLVKVGKFEA